MLHFLFSDKRLVSFSEAKLEEEPERQDERFSFQVSLTSEGSWWGVKSHNYFSSARVSIRKERGKKINL